MRVGDLVRHVTNDEIVGIVTEKQHDRTSNTLIYKVQWCIPSKEQVDCRYHLPHHLQLVEDAKPKRT